MAVRLLFQKLNEYVLVVVNGKKVLFGSTHHGAMLAEIDGLQLDYQGVLKEFPDLVNNPQWRQEAIKRFKEKIDFMQSEEEIVNYLARDLISHGYILKSRQDDGFRPVMVR